MLEDIVDLFTSSKLTPVILIIAGLILCVVEIVTNKGYFGLFGGILVIADIFAVMMLHGTMIQFAVLVVVSILVIVVPFCIMLLVDHTAFVKPHKLGSEEVEEAYDESKLLKLVGKKGVTITECNPEGKFNLNGVNLDGVSEKGNLPKNSEVVITKIEGIKIFIKQDKE